MRLTSHRDDADVIRARLRVLLDEGRRSGWLPDDPTDDTGGPPADDPADPLDEDASDDLDDGPADGRYDGRRELGRHRVPARAVRLDPGRRGSRALWVAGLLAALALAGWTWLDRPTVEPAPAAAPAPAPSAESSSEEEAQAQPTVVVSVVGLVVRPGLVTLPEGARVADALAAAGGLLPEADPASVNLAAVVSDGEQIAVGVPGVAPPPAAAGGGGGTPSGPLDLNSATAADLDALPGIGPVLAQRIVDHRDATGRFTSVEQLDDVPGIGPTTYAELTDLVRV